MKNSFLLFSFLCLAACADGRDRLPLRELLKTRKNLHLNDHLVSTKVSSVHVAQQDCQKEADEIIKLPGQPNVNFSQYSGYVTVDPKAGRSLFYYFAEGVDPASKPLVLWLNGGPGCSSLGAGAMTELGPFRVNPDGKTLKYNTYAWNRVANILFLESPAGVGFSYSNTLSDYVTGDTQTAADSCVFLHNWFERFPEYKNRDFFLAGESYSGHYIPQLADLILVNNKNTKHTFIKLKGFAIGNAYIDFTDTYTGRYDYMWTHALISDKTHQAIINHCNFTSLDTISKDCENYTDIAEEYEFGNIDPYNIYGPICGSKASAHSKSSSDPCTENYVYAYLNTPKVQEALHANISRSLPGQWQICSDPVHDNWTDKPTTTLPLIKKLIGSGNIRVLIYSGDMDAVIPVTATKYSMAKLGASVRMKWYPWYEEAEVGGYAVGYDKVTFATVRAAGHMVPSDQPGRALTLFTSFLKGELPPGENKKHS